MDIRRETLGAAVRLAMVLSTVAAFLTIGIGMVGGVGEISATALVTAVAAVCFMSSWVLTGRIARTAPVMPRHRVAIVPARQRVA